MPIMTFFLSLDGEFIDANHLTQLTNIPDNQGYSSHRDLKMTPLKKLFKNETVELLYSNTKNIEKNKHQIICEELGSLRWSHLHRPNF